MNNKTFLNSAHSHHIMTGWTSPMRLWSIGFALAALLTTVQRPGLALGFSLAASIVLWLFACRVTTRIFGHFLERPFPFRRIEDLPAADVIVVLGGGVGRISAHYPHPRLYAAAERVMHAVRLWKSGKAPFILTSGGGERWASLPLLLELGVPRSALKVENKSQDTEENARAVGKVLSGRAKTVLLVTSAWHMRRAMMLFRRYAPALTVIPAATDYIAPSHTSQDLPVDAFLPNAEALVQNSTMLKECLGCLWYRLVK